MAPPKAPSSRPGAPPSQGHKRMQSSPDASNRPPKRTARGAGPGSSASSSSRGRGASTRGGSVRQGERASESQRRESASSSVVASFSAEQFGTAQVVETEADVVDGPELAVEPQPSQGQRNVESVRANTRSSQARPPSSLTRPMQRPPQLQTRPSNVSSSAVTSSFEHISSPPASDGGRNEHAPVARSRPTSVVTQPLHQDTSRRWSTRSWSDPALTPSGLSSSPPSSSGSSAAGPRSIFRFAQSGMTSLVYETARQLEKFMWTQQPFMTGRELEVVSYLFNTCGRTK